MGEVITEVTLVNIGDQEVANRGYMPQEQVRRLTVNAVVDTGAWTRQQGLALVINEAIREKVGLRVEGTLDTTVAGGGKVPSQVTEEVRICWKNRKASCEAVVLPDETEVLLGALPLEAMDLTVNPKRKEVVGAHGDTRLSVVK